jgi:ribonuclease BN (tRNA processing enzyme)
MPDQITLLGVKGGPAVRPGSAMPTSSLLELAGEILLIDCAIGVTRSIVETGLRLTDLRTIFITHLHSDHVLELGPLLYTAWTTGLTEPVTVYGPKGTAAYWDAFLSAMTFDHDIRIDDEGRTPIRDLIQMTEYGEGDVAQIGCVRVRALRVCHPPVTDTFALRFDAPGRAVVFSADTCYFPPLAEFARGADVLVHEAMLTEGVDRLVARTAGGERLRRHLLASHTPAADVGRIASQAMVGRLVLTHLVPIDDPELTEAHWQAEAATHWNGTTIVGGDGLVIPLG